MQAEGVLKSDSACLSDPEHPELTERRTDRSRQHILFRDRGYSYVQGASCDKQVVAVAEICAWLLGRS